MNSTIINNFPFVVSEERWRKERLGMNRFIERIHSRVQQPCNCIGTKESVYIRKGLNSYRIGLVHQHGRCFTVLEQQYGRHMWSCAYALYLTLAFC